MANAHLEQARGASPLWEGGLAAVTLIALAAALWLAPDLHSLTERRSSGRASSRYPFSLQMTNDQ
jgi:hypothetical protein